MGRMTSLELPDRSILRDGNPIHLQPMRPSAVLKVHLGPNLLLPVVHRSGPLVPRVFGHFLLFSTLLRGHLSLLKLLHWSLLLQIWNSVQSEVSKG